MTLAPLAQIAKAVFRAPSWMLPNERPRFVVDDRPMMRDPESGDMLRLTTYRVNDNSDVIMSTLRHAITTVEIRDYEIRHDKGAAVRRVAEAVAYLTTLLFPRPLPRFRIRRDARWGRA